MKTAVVNRIDRVFAERKRENRIALMPYLAVGYRTVDETLALAPALAAAGADMIELGVPFSDPLADGATIQHATQVALRQGVTPARCIEVAAAIRRTIDTPLLLMSYYNPILHYGPDRFCADAAAAGIDGLIVPDLPPEESAELRDPARARGLHPIYFAAPTSTDDRLRVVGEFASGFIYCVSLTGVTGARQSLSAGLGSFLGRVRQHTDVPLVVGFGISRPEHVREVAAVADGAIVASALIDRLDRAPVEKAIETASSFVSELKGATGRAGSHTQS